MRAPWQRDPLQAPRFSFRLVISGRSSTGASNVEVVFFNPHPQHAPDFPFSVAQVAIGAGGASPSLGRAQLPKAASRGSRDMGGLRAQGYRRVEATGALGSFSSSAP